LEHGVPLKEEVMGVAWDGYGYGQDRNAWGAEFLIADYDGFERYAHFRNVPLPGGDLAALQPWRMALSYLIDIFGMDIPQTPVMKKLSRRQIQGLKEMIRQKINSPLASSCGRLFDAVSYLLDLSPSTIEFEAEAPMRLEAAADQSIHGKYGFTLDQKRDSMEINFAIMFQSLMQDIERGQPVPTIAAKFHNTLAALIVDIACRVRKLKGIETIVLSGGVFLNRKLLERADSLLRKNGFRVLRPIIYSPNDESISVGQIAYGLRELEKKNSFFIKNRRKNASLSRP
jgi:hydrogenase maturation protein HypF